MAFKVEVKGLQSVIKQLDLYMKDLNIKLDTFIQRLAEEGVEIAKSNISIMGAVDSGELLESMNLKKGDVITNGSCYYIYTDCYHAKFVEFGTGIIGAESPHPIASEEFWKYDSHEHGENGWYFWKWDKMNWTQGYFSRPFMYDTAQELYFKISEVASEVFG